MGIGGHHRHLLKRIDPVDRGHQLRPIPYRRSRYKTTNRSGQIPTGRSFGRCKVYTMAAIIELARAERGNPEVPDWLQEEYFRSIQELAEMGAKEILRADDSEAIRAILQRHCDCQRSSDAWEVPRRVFRGRVVGNGIPMSVIACLQQLSS